VPVQASAYDYHSANRNGPWTTAYFSGHHGEQSQGHVCLYVSFRHDHATVVCDSDGKEVEDFSLEETFVAKPKLAKKNTNKKTVQAKRIKLDNRSAKVFDASLYGLEPLEDDRIYKPKANVKNYATPGKSKQPIKDIKSQVIGVLRDSEDKITALVKLFESSVTRTEAAELAVYILLNNLIDDYIEKNPETKPHFKTGETTYNVLYAQFKHRSTNKVALAD